MYILRYRECVGVGKIIVELIPGHKPVCKILNELFSFSLFITKC